MFYYKVVEAISRLGFSMGGVGAAVKMDGIRQEGSMLEGREAASDIATYAQLLSVAFSAPPPPPPPPILVVVVVGYLGTTLYCYTLGGYFPATYPRIRTRSIYYLRSNHHHHYQQRKW